MPQFSLRFDIPNAHPFNRGDWFIQAYGEVLIPLVTDFAPSRFWFSRYAGGNVPKHVMFRYEAVTQIVNPNWVIVPTEHVAFNIHQDLSQPRLHGLNQRKADANERGSQVFDFLHAGAQLTLDQLSHKDNNGYWVLEVAQHNDNHYGRSLEVMHHLFCNMSDVPTAVIDVGPVVAAQRGLMSRYLSPLYAKALGLYDYNAPPAVERIPY
jgi:hypothetical protein